MAGKRKSSRPSPASANAGSRSSRKQLRQKLLEALLFEGKAKTQPELVAALAKRGIKVTQATVSRDLREMGARKLAHSSGAAGYALAPDEVRDSYLEPAKDALMRRALAGSVAAVHSSGDIVLIKTLPGHAPYVASLVDSASLARVLGTVAGDDTIIVVCEEGSGGVVREVIADLTGAPRR